MTDCNIVQLIRERNEKGLQALYDRYGPILYGIILRTVKDKSIAEDVLSQTMLKAWDKISSYTAEKSLLFTWLNTIARHTSIDMVRHKSFKNAQKTDSLDILVCDVGSEHSTESLIDVKQITRKLDKKYKLILDMIYIQGYSHSEISKKLDIPLGTVKTRRRNAIQQLRDDLKGEKGLFMGY